MNTAKEFTPTRERADCSVNAVSAAMGVPYQTALAALARAGRKRGCGCHYNVALKAIRQLGGKVQEVPLVKHQSMKTLASEVPSGHAYVAFMRNHLAPIVDGHVDDWAASTRRVVKKLWRVTT
jgi:hypothetical protein